jgi:hypothetical protein
MDKFITISSENIRYSDIFIVFDVNITYEFIFKVLKQNDQYFDLARKRLSWTNKFKFQRNRDFTIMRTFSKNGFEAATYIVTDDYRMMLYKEDIQIKEVYSNNVLKMVSYDEDEFGEMRFQILDEKGYDPVGDSFTFVEGIEFIDNSNPYFYSYHSGYRS